MSVATKVKSRWSEFIPQTWVCLKEKYTFSIFKHDLIAGVTVGIVALPLAMAFAIASGVEPSQGLFTAIIAGFLVSLLGGSRVQIGGPTGAFVVIVYDVVQRQGYAGLVLAMVIAAVILILMGIFRLGSLIKFIPYPLITGLTTGIALIIFSSQVKDFFGLNIAFVPSEFIPKWQVFFRSLHVLDPMTFGVAASSLTLIILIRRFIPVVPWGIGSIVIATFVCWAFHLPVETVSDRFGEIPRTLPVPAFPEFHWNWQALQRLVPDVVTIALLAGIESLLSAVIADGMTGKKHNSNCELIAQGIANIGSALFGGIPATGALARTATNVKCGGKTPLAGMIHAITLFALIFLFAPLVGQIPLAALAAVLVMVAWNMSEIDHFRYLLKAPLGDVVVMISTFLLTVLVDITVAVEVGMILAAFLFMKRMSEQPHAIAPASFLEERDDPDAISKKQVPKGVDVYEITGPLFFGVADSFKDVLHNIEFPPKVFILRMRKVPVIDASGMHALKEFYFKCQREKTVLVLSGVQPQLHKAVRKYGLEALIGKENIFPHIDPALDHSRQLVKGM